MAKLGAISQLLGCRDGSLLLCLKVNNSLRSIGSKSLEFACIISRQANVAQNPSFTPFFVGYLFLQRSS